MPAGFIQRAAAIIISAGPSLRQRTSICWKDAEGKAVFIAVQTDPGNRCWKWDRAGIRDDRSTITIFDPAITKSLPKNLRRI